MLEFTIVAGPNGAGKSSFSYLYAPPGAEIHDADKIKVALLKKFRGAEIDPEALDDFLAEEYVKFEEDGLVSKRSMLVETNLRMPYLIDRALYLRSKGYTLNLMFIALENTIVSKERVDARVKGKGHWVDPMAIDENFYHGLLILKKYINIFDNFMLVTPNLKMVTSDPHLPTPLLMIKAGRIVYRIEYEEPWANELVAELISLVRPV